MTIRHDGGKRRPRIYFSFRSPYSWLTIHRLRCAVPDAFDRLDWYPYWDPDEPTAAALAERGAQLHYAQMSRAKHRYLLLDTKRLAQGLGLAMAWPIDVDPWWEPAHLGFLAARRVGRSAEFYEAVIRARWQRGERIWEPDVLRRVARESTVDPDLVLGAADDPQLRAAGVDCLVEADQDDVFGIPYLRWGRQRFWGYDRLAAFLDAWRLGGEPAAERRPEPALVPLGAGYDSDTAGGCG
jgi:2-hydroxychromene-2-carboxylate isomerase